MKLVFLLGMFLVAKPLIALSIFHERLVWYENPHTQALFIWSTDQLSQADKVMIGSNEDIAAAQKFDSCESDSYKRYHTYFHQCWVDGLEPSSQYYFWFESDGTRTGPYTFFTAPKNIGDSKHKLLFGGDSRSEHKKRREMNRLMSSYVRNNPETLAFVHGGDFVDEGDDPHRWHQWFNDVEFLRIDNRILPIVPTQGNHESDSELFAQVFGRPRSGTSHYYNFNFAELSLLTLNTNLSHYGDQRVWLEQELEAAKSSQWILANYHRPAYPAVKRPGDALNAWVPLFEDYNLDLVFESDGHVYKQTSPIFAGEVNKEKGIIYVGEGGLGVKLRSPKSDRWYLEGGMSQARYHFQVLTVSKDHLLYEAIDDNAKIFSTLKREPRERSAKSGEGEKGGEQDTPPASDLPQPPASDLPQPPQPPGDDDDSNEGLSGIEVYLKECAVCHGDEGEGTERGYRIQFPVRKFAKAITRKGREGNPYFEIEMPAYDRKMVSDRQMDEMWDFLHSVARPSTGQGIYETFCANCHGVDGRGGLSRESVLGELDEVEEYVREGEGWDYFNRRKYMPRWSRQELSDWEIRKMISYLYTLGGKGGDDDDDDDDDDHGYGKYKRKHDDDHGYGKYKRKHDDDDDDDD